MRLPGLKEDQAIPWHLELAYLGVGWSPVHPNRLGWAALPYCADELDQHQLACVDRPLFPEARGVAHVSPNLLLPWQIERQRLAEEAHLSGEELGVPGNPGSYFSEGLRRAH